MHRDEVRVSNRRRNGSAGELVLDRIQRNDPAAFKVSWTN